ncbi:MAG: hypothetical protein O0X93_04240 [Methanocorpusculum sp.]|nr:hypothetical protein [Methanocorpusculum sp.]MDE2522361.1 hypothetical protein [Methanocorpusculum sp.]MDE2524041.1 hypothetical protein [Methanocorpusculum sp.]
MEELIACGAGACGSSAGTHSNTNAKVPSRTIRRTAAGLDDMIMIPSVVLH